MRGIGKILAASGHTVTGSDLKIGGHKAENITPNIDVVIRTSAVSPGSPGWVEVERAEELGIKVIKRSEALGEITADKFLISVSGMHGKTTVTSLIGLILIEAGLDPTVLVGEEVPEFGDVVRMGQSKYFVMEACEYDRSFLDFTPDIAVITNIDKEHLDTYPNGIPDIVDAFDQFIAKIKAGGKLVYYAGDQNLQGLANKHRNIESVAYGDAVFDRKIRLLGDHNKKNAQAALAVATILGISDFAVNKVFEKFKGAHRRLEYKGNFKGAKVFDDYGHHPTEIKTTIAALKKEFPTKKIVVVFWPHQYKRILPLLSEFAEAFSFADKVILKPIFLVPGRDERLDVSSEKIAELINSSSQVATVISDDEEICQLLAKQADDDSIILTIGIPPVYKIADKILKESK